MKVLHLSPTLPWPPDSGGRIGIWNLIRANARFASVGLVSFVESPPSASALEAIRSVCAEVELVRRPRTLDGVVGGARSLLSSLAMNLAKYRWPVYSEALARVMLRWNPDIVVAHHLHMASYLQEVAAAAVFLREHNIDSDLMARYAASLRNRTMAAFAARQAEQIREAEARLCPRVNACLVITPDDEAKLKEIAPTARTLVVPGGINLADYAPVDPALKTQDPLVVTTGTFSFRPTGEGLVEFVETTWPRIRKAVPRARLRVIGECPQALRKRLGGSPGLEILGRVEEVRPHLVGAHAFVVPLRVGSGMRIRILEAMAYQLPVVSTTIGCEGLHVQDGRHLLIADMPEAMAGAVIRLLREPTLAQTLRREGHRLIERSYSLDVVESLTGRIFRKALPEAAVDARDAS